MSRFDDDAWRLTRHASPRAHVRVTDPAIDGEIVNSYPRQALIGGPAPETPWAMYLADDAGAYRYLCFDLDAGRGNAANDADRLAFWLTDLNIDHLVCESGPTGGRHVWLALEHAAAAPLVETLARMAAQLLPSLDIIPLTNPRTGCVRPPGSPHRLGGFSVARQGTIASFVLPSVTADDLDTLRTFLADSGASITPPRTSPAKGMGFDTAGHPHLLGTRRHLTDRAQHLLDSEPEADTSVTLARALVTLARARWRFDDVAELLRTSPALVHARSTVAPGGTRRPTTEATAARRLTAEWSRAVYFAAANPVSATGQDEDFVRRAGGVAAAVGRCEAHAASMPGLWGFDVDSRPARAHRGRRVHRLVLDAVCLYMVQSAQTTVEVDTRRLAEDTGYGRESCRLALLALALPVDGGNPESAWIVKTDECVGVHGSKFRLSTRFSTEMESQEWAQENTRPSGSLELRQWWIQELSQLLAPLAADLFAAPGSLGRTAGRVFAVLPAGGSLQLEIVARRAQISHRTAFQILRLLDQVALARRTGSGWQREETVDLTQAAEMLGVGGYLSARRVRYVTERAVWSWWNAEHKWMTTRGKRRRGKQGGAGLALFAQSYRTEYPYYPRRSDKRADHRKAKQFAAAGALRAPNIWGP